MSQWPDREAWAADAEHVTRTRMYATERVSNSASEYLAGSDRDDLLELAKWLRLELGRLIRAVDDPDATVEGVTRIYLASRARRLAEAVDAVEARRAEAAQVAEDAAVAAEIERRQTDRAWQRELDQRAQIERYRANGPLVGGGAR